MKLRTSFCNWPVIRKDSTRFAPLWLVYLICGSLVMMTTVSYNRDGVAAREIGVTISYLSVVNLVYAWACANVIFGDLFKGRLCNALHALPLRRETWFCSHCISGLLFSLVPHLIAAPFMMIGVGSFWYVVLLWLLGLLLQYLFFFGTAVLSILCTGNRIAMTAVYAILNFGALVLYWFLATIYEPLLPGVILSEDPFFLFCPLSTMLKHQDLVQMAYAKPGLRPDGLSDWYFVGMGEGWVYLAVCAVLGIAFLALALVLYRRRKLECAGDFLAIKPLEPVFSLVFTLCIGCLFTLLWELLSGTNQWLLAVGMLIGWFASRMLLERSVKVFRWKNFVKFAILVAVLGASMVATWLDPLRISQWTPSPEKVAFAEVEMGYGPNSYMKLTDEEDIRILVAGHQARLQEEDPEDGMTRLNITYTMKDGQKHRRYYWLTAGTGSWETLRPLYSRPETILGYTDWEAFINTVEVTLPQGYLKDLCHQYVMQTEPSDSSVWEEKTEKLLKELTRSLLEAMKKDCEQGLLPPSQLGGELHYYDDIWLNGNGGSGRVTRFIQVYQESENTQAWLNAHRDILKGFEGNGK